jgi:hypothetical protein
LGWHGELCLGVSTDPTVVPAEALANGVRDALAELLANARPD